LGYFRMGPRNILQPLLEQAALEQQTLGTPSQKTLLEIADKLVRWATNMYSSFSNQAILTRRRLLLRRY
jgi:hypothetical protein